MHKAVATFTVLIIVLIPLSIVIRDSGSRHAATQLPQHTVIKENWNHSVTAKKHPPTVKIVPRALRHSVYVNSGFLHIDLSQGNNRELPSDSRGCAGKQKSSDSNHGFSLMNINEK